VRALAFLATFVGVALVLGVAPAGATRECEGLMVCVSKAGPWVLVPTSSAVPRKQVEFQLECPKGYVVAGLDAELSQRAIDVSFIAILGSPVSPGVTTARAVVFVASFVGASARTASFRPHLGCMPASGGGGRIPTAVQKVLAGHPTTRRVRTVRVRPGSFAVAQSCTARERLVDGTHAFGFYTRKPPSASLASSVSGTLAFGSDHAVVVVRADAEISGVRAVVQVQAVCARAR
jgi:hypothetical protein